LKHPLPQGRTIERTILLQYRITKAINDLLQRRPARLHHDPGLDVRIHHMNAMRLLKPCRRSTLTAANTASQADDKSVRKSHCDTNQPCTVQRASVYGERTAGV